MENNIPNPTIEERQNKDKQAILEALKEMPIIQVACKKVGIGRATYYRWRKEDKVFARQSGDAMGQGIEFINDMSESQLVTLIKEKKMPAITLWLKHHHPRYGSKNQPYIPITSADELSPEEENIVLKALALASGETYENKNQHSLSRKNSRKQASTTTPGV